MALRQLAGFLIGSVPISNVIARALYRRDLRDVGTGTVSPTGVQRLGGTAPFLLAVACETAKGALGAAVIGAEKPWGAGLVIAGHNWSVFLRGAGGRGVTPSIGVLARRHPAAAFVLVLGVLAGRVIRITSLGAVIGECAIVAALAVANDRRGARTGLALALPMLAKRLMGNRFHHGPNAATVYLNRFLYDQDFPPGGQSGRT